MRKDTKTAQALASSLYFLFDFNNEAHNKDVIRTLKPTTVFLYFIFSSFLYFMPGLDLFKDWYFGLTSSPLRSFTWSCE